MRYSKKVTWADFQENAVLFLTLILSVSVALLDFLGVLDTFPLISNRIPAFILITLATLTTYVAFIHPKKQDLRHNFLVDKVESFEASKEFRVHHFKDFNTCLNYVNRKIKQSKNKVYSIYWDAELSLKQDIGSEILHREIILIDETNRFKFKSLLKKRLSIKEKSYSCAFHRVAKDIALQFIIIDSKEIIFISNLSSHNMVFQNPDIVKLFEHHYDEMWQKASKLKWHDRIYEENIEKALAEPIEAIPANLEKCVRDCLKMHELSKRKI